MPFETLVARCPKTGKELLFGGNLPLEESHFPNYIRVKSLMDFQLTIACPIQECGEQHTFRTADLRQAIIPIKEPDSIEEHVCGEFIIELEFYRLDDGSYSVWPYMRRASTSPESKIHFVVEPSFPNKEVLRTIALRIAEEKISEGLGLTS
jgi:hypothetical protein